MGVRANLKVLLVEDDHAMRALLSEELEDAGFAVLSTGHAESGVELARAEAVDLVVTDLRMPEMDGFDLIRALTALPAPPHIIMITAFGSIETAIRAVKLGAYDYITKPFDVEELLMVLDKAQAERALRQDVARLQREVETRYQVGQLVAHSAPMRDVVALVERLADSTATVLVTGESGTGKELVARAIHYTSARRTQPFVAVNVAAIPEALLESELFGHKKGAFTDARQDHPGLFVQANHGTLFLDEIGELAPSLQAKLLRVLQEHEVRPLGAAKTTPIEVRVIAATNRKLEPMLEAGTFREDLYYRLNVVGLDLPPLRARREDILPLAKHTLEALQAKSGHHLTLSAGAEAKLLAYHWPGNVRELVNVLERGAALCRNQLLTEAELPPSIREEPKRDFLAEALAHRLTLAELEQRYIERVLHDEGGNKSRAAQRLGLDRKTLYRKLDEYGKQGATGDDRGGHG